MASQYNARGWIVRRTVYLVGPDGNIVFSKRGMPSPIELLERIPGVLHDPDEALATTPA